MVVKIKKQNVQKSLSYKNIKFKDYKTCLKSTQLENKIN